MIKVENVEVFGWEAAIRGMRNPMNSWAKSDSHIHKEDCEDCPHKDEYHKHVLSGNACFHLGQSDFDLAQRLYKGGTEHRKYLRMIHVQMDITAPLYWWKEFDTYKVGTTANSCSTMHKMHAKEFELDDFSYEHLNKEGRKTLRQTISYLNQNRKRFTETNNKQYWWYMMQLLPSSYNQRRTVDFSYETAVNIIKQRSGHKLDEWHEFVNILRSLPYVAEIRGEVEE